MTAGESPSADRDPRLQRWLTEMTSRLAPGRIRIPRDGTLQDAVAIMLADEELKVRASPEGDLRAVKLAAIARLRRQFMDAEPPLSSPTSSAKPSANQGQAIYELVMGELETVPLARLADLVNLWMQLVNGMGAEMGLSAPELAEMSRGRVELNAGAAEPELVASFKGPSEIVRQFRAYLKEAGIDAGDKV
jgi:hypothetical protein